MDSPRYPNIVVQLTGEDGNAFAVLGRVQSAMRKAGLDINLVSQFLREAMKGDYDHLLNTVQEWVTVE